MQTKKKSVAKHNLFLIHAKSVVGVGHSLGHYPCDVSVSREELVEMTPPYQQGLPQLH